MNRFMGGFATATAILIAATVAGHEWPAIGFATAIFMPAVWLLARAARRHREDPPPPVADTPPGVFAGRPETAARTSPDRR